MLKMTTTQIEGSREINLTSEAYKNGDNIKAFSITKQHMQPYAATDSRKIDK